ncbi:hypothetical protein KIN20_037539 [Parelaphostrongylus tenuis]|uniref:Uncharacterized protein n=1 Tax=Parelaphostrongylus tenuis TaxID=148309 RepID=A0AAD5RI44_PARTN|nr:hypothetical protein KIN20_037539 [Parelaphostrongylus tenuis]
MEDDSNRISRESNGLTGDDDEEIKMKDCYKVILCRQITSTNSQTFNAEDDALRSQQNQVLSYQTARLSAQEIN